ncbi:DUF4865 family protein [Pseudonocardia broussonetiae]|uniref:DUF4865 family protein n=1 Tax=Pseudonocardia broussonetiae TaxID=2736640 RepID=A0A6M6JR61_9PSEU|nr:DUF4865 family protein [Pseudonocardia broussonetiae]QJY50398.1 DUF4865 family protein [Pseudonocardia broussonetiae]
MQYEVTLPADYDMRIIRDRVAATGHLMDPAPDWPTPPSHAVRRKTALAADVDIVGMARATDARLASAVAVGEAQLGAYGIDPRGWELVTLTLHDRHPGGVPEGAELSAVLHTAAPERLRLPDRVEERLAIAR